LAGAEVKFASALVLDGKPTALPWVFLMEMKITMKSKINIKISNLDFSTSMLNVRRSHCFGN